jgi:homotetrameric cytidine deaminase
MSLTPNQNQFTSYSPYSHQHTLCVVQGSSGTLYPGVRIENASFPLTITASQVAFFTCLSEGDLPVAVYKSNDQKDENLQYLATFHNIPIKEILELPDKTYYRPATEPFGTIETRLISLRQSAIVSESDFRVSCILQLDNDTWITGVNIEYPDWQIGLCAERVAMCKAVVYNLVKHITKIHVNASGGSFISPCGACRQVLIEHTPYQSIHLHHPDGSESMTTPAQLLPAFFNGSSLRK